MLSIAKPPSAEARVILVDDDPAVRNSLAFAFGFEGLKVETFDSAETLLDAGAADADCLVVDYRLPGRDGLDLIEQLRERGALAPVLLITSHPKAALKARAASLGVSVIEKPLLSDELADAIRDVLARSRLA